MKNTRSTVAPENTPRIVERQDHPISRKSISDKTLKVLYHLHKHGYEAFLVGGGVRDLLLGLEPKDFDVATDATPQQIRRIFSNSRIIGRRFLLVHVYYHRELVEVATFRKTISAHEKFAKHHKGHTNSVGMIIDDNHFGTLEDDVYRRDFTINALYYNIADFSIVDYVGGLEDIKRRVIRMIGDPFTRYQEDPVRILRAIRFAAKLNFEIEANTREPIARCAHLLAHVPTARMYDEIQKMFFTGHALASFHCLHDNHLFLYLMPTLHDFLADEENSSNNPTKHFLSLFFEFIDNKYAHYEKTSAAFLFAGLLWDPIWDFMSDLELDNLDINKMRNAVLRVIRLSGLKEMLPAQVVEDMISIIEVQFVVEHMSKSVKTFNRLFSNNALDSGVELLFVRMHSGEKINNLDWWLAYEKADLDKRRNMRYQFKLKVEGGQKDVLDGSLDAQFQFAPDAKVKKKRRHKKKKKSHTGDMPKDFSGDDATSNA